MSYDFPEFAQGQIGRLRYNHLNTAFRLLERLEPFLPLLESMRQGGKTPDVRRPPFWAEITGFFPIPNEAYRWLYSWRRVGWHANDRKWNPKYKPSALPPGSTKPGASGGDDPPESAPVEMNSTLGGDPFAMAAVNGCENGNTTVFAGGIDITQGAYVGCGLTVKPIPKKTVVLLHHEHGMLGLNQITGGRYPICFGFNLWNPHDKAGASQP